MNTNVLSVQLYNKGTDWEAFQSFVNNLLKFQVALKFEENIDNATNALMTSIQSACWESTPEKTGRWERIMWFQLTLNSEQKTNLKWLRKKIKRKLHLTKPAKELKTLSPI
ncbi:jg14450 [Pararge aegeria aegeria]|uniref:Jg14450 protein n=1 Tax=Pararge aegeria aegeria TaxID=348720 RepID=A0A8S4S0N7_9NEOP|nr:jg14450 [Pararge aegeria aegeria]